MSEQGIDPLNFANYNLGWHAEIVLLSLPSLQNVRLCVLVCETTTCVKQRPLYSDEKHMLLLYREI